MRNKDNITQSYFALAIGLMFMGFAAIFIRSAHAPGLVTVFYRMSIASVILLVPFLISLNKQKTALPKKGVMFAMLAGIFFGIDMFLWSTAVVYTNATIPTIFANLAPIWVGIGAIVFLKEKPKRSFWIGVSVAVAGAFILLANEFNNTSSILIGVYLGLAAGVFYASFYLLSQPGRKKLNTLSFLYISTTSSAIVLFVLMLVYGHPFFKYDTHSFIMFVGIGIGGQVIAWYCVNYAQGFLPATIIAPTLLAQPVLTAIFAIVLLKEKLTILQIIGGVVIILGIYIVHHKKTKKQGRKN